MVRIQPQSWRSGGVKVSETWSQKEPLNKVCLFLYLTSLSSDHPRRLCGPPGKWEIFKKTCPEGVDLILFGDHNIPHHSFDEH